MRDIGFSDALFFLVTTEWSTTSGLFWTQLAMCYSNEEHDCR